MASTGVSSTGGRNPVTFSLKTIKPTKKAMIAKNRKIDTGWRRRITRFMANHINLSKASIAADRVGLVRRSPTSAAIDKAELVCLPVIAFPFPRALRQPVALLLLPDERHDLCTRYNRQFYGDNRM